MASKIRRHLSKQDIDEKAEEVIIHFDSSAFKRNTSPIYEVLKGLMDRYSIPVRFGQDLGFSKKGKKILGRFDFSPRMILIDKLLPDDSPRFRWTLCHEIGHLVLHRNLDPSRISRNRKYFVDTKEDLRFIRTAHRSELEWIEWQANQFASALLLPRPIVHTAVSFVQRQLGIPRPGSIYLDQQPQNVSDYMYVSSKLSELLSVSRTVLRIRLLNLGILIDTRPFYRDHLQETLRALFVEE